MSGVSSNDYSDSELDQELNIGYQRLCALLAHIEPSYFSEERSKFNLLENSGLYSQPEDCIAVRQIRLAYSTPSSDSDYNIATTYGIGEVHDPVVDEENVPTTNPIIEITGGHFRIKPKPASAVSDGGMIYYIAMPSALSQSASIPMIPIAYHEQISTYGARSMTFKYEKWKKHDRLDKMWNDTVAELTQTATDRDENRPLRFRSLQEVGSTSNRRELPDT